MDMTMTMGMNAAPRKGVGVPAWVLGAGIALDHANDRYWYNNSLGALSGISTFARNSLAFRVNSGGVLDDAPVDTLRRDFTFSPPGALIEAQPDTTNLLLRSDDISNASWSKTNCTISGTGPYTMTDDATAGNHTIFQNVSAVNGTVYRAGVIVKAGTLSRVILRQIDANVTGLFVLSGAGTASNVAGAADARIQYLGDGWYFCSIAFTANATALRSVNVRMVSTGTTDNYSGTGSTLIFKRVWIEAETLPSSPMLTAGTTAVRKPDNFTVGLTGFGLRTMSCDVRLLGYPTGATAATVLQADDGSENNRARIVYIPATGKMRGQVTVGGVDQADMDLGAYVLGSERQIALSWAQDLFSGGMDGNVATSDVSGSDLTGLTTWRYGAGVALANPGNVLVSRAFGFAQTVPASALV